MLTVKHRNETKEIHISDLIELGRRMEAGSTEVDFIIALDELLVGENNE